MNKISFKISREMLMEMAALKTPEDGFEYIENCFAIDKNRIKRCKQYTSQHSNQF